MIRSLSWLPALGKAHRALAFGFTFSPNNVFYYMWGQRERDRERITLPGYGCGVPHCAERRASCVRSLHKSAEKRRIRECRHDIHSFAGPWNCAHSFARHFSYIHTGAPAPHT